MEQTTALTDGQMAGMLDLIISQEKDLLELKMSVYALTKIARASIGEQFEPLYEELRQQLRTEATSRGHDQRIELLESMSLQLKQTGKPIQ